jgi:hypothetical protein
MSSRDKFLAEIEAFLRRHKMAPTRLGLATMNNAKFVRVLRDGEGCTLDTYDKVRAWMRDYDEQHRRVKKKPNHASVAA